MSERFLEVDFPTSLQLGQSPEEWLHTLPGSCWMRIQGKDSSRCRVFTTLLHGNEPSGFRALWRWLRRPEIPRVDLILVIASVQTARIHPPYSLRQRPDGRDPNRCFRPPFEGSEGSLPKIYWHLSKTLILKRLSIYTILQEGGQPLEYPYMIVPNIKLWSSYSATTW